jgi:hypothetical protein
VKEAAVEGFEEPVGREPGGHAGEFEQNQGHAPTSFFRRDSAGAP